MVQASTNLQSWIDLGTLEIQDVPTEFVDASAAQHQSRYYRVQLFSPAGVTANNSR